MNIYELKKIEEDEESESNESINIPEEIDKFLT